MLHIITPTMQYYAYYAVLRLLRSINHFYALLRDYTVERNIWQYYACCPYYVHYAVLHTLLTHYCVILRLVRITTQL